MTCKKTARARGRRNSKARLKRRVAIFELLKTKKKKKRKIIIIKKGVVSVHRSLSARWRSTTSNRPKRNYQLMTQRVHEQSVCICNLFLIDWFDVWFKSPLDLSTHALSTPPFLFIFPSSHFPLDRYLLKLATLLRCRV